MPLDSRTRLTKTDWCLWSATLAGDRADFEAIVAPIYDYLNDTTARLPFVDSYVTDNRGSDGMRARPVIGGVVHQDARGPGDLEEVGEPRPDESRRNMPRSRFRRESPRSCRPRSVSRQPGGTRWPNLQRDGRDLASMIRLGNKAQADSAALGLQARSSGRPGTRRDIWLRREVALPSRFDSSRLQLRVYHDEDVEIFVERNPGGR